MLRIRDVFPRSRILIFTRPGSRISDPGFKNSNKREVCKKICCHTIFWSHKFHKIKNYFILKCQKIVTTLSKYGFGIGIRDSRSGSGIRDPGPGSEIRDPGPGKNLFRIPDPGVKKDPGFGSATLCFIIRLNVWKYLWSISG